MLGDHIIYPLSWLVIKIILIAITMTVYFVYLRKHKGNYRQICAVVILMTVVVSSCIGGEKDSDGDGVLDGNDAFPYDKTQWIDADRDGHGDNPLGHDPDMFPDERTQWMDTDKDGYGDNPLGNNSDAFPKDPTEWMDSDRDGLGDNADELPYKSSDINPSGNGLVRLKILQFNAHTDERNGVDSLFVSKIDLGNKGAWDFIARPGVTWNDNNITDFTIWTLDVNDAYVTLRFDIQVFDTSWLNVTSSMDMNPDPDFNSMTHIIKAPFHYQWTFTGDAGDNNCSITYILETIDAKSKLIVNPNDWSKSVVNESSNRIIHTGPSIIGIPLINYGYMGIFIIFIAIIYRMAFWIKMRKSTWKPVPKKEKVTVEIIEASPEIVQDIEYKVIR